MDWESTYECRVKQIFKNMRKEYRADCSDGYNGTFLSWVSNTENAGVIAMLFLDDVADYIGVEEMCEMTK